MSYLLTGKRAKEMASVAQSRGIMFAPDDQSHLADSPFSLFWQSEPRPAENVMAATIRGTIARGFDFPYLADRQADATTHPVPHPPMRYDDGQQYGCVVAATRGWLPFVHVSPRGRKNQLDRAPSCRPDTPSSTRCSRRGPNRPTSCAGSSPRR